MLSVLPTFGLAIHTSSPDLGLAIANSTDTSRCQSWDLGRDLSTHLHLHLAEFLQPQTWSDLAFIAVAKGPGGFTGTRIGVVTARTLAQQLDLPLFAISSLKTIAWANQVNQPNQGDIAVQMQAQRGELFVAIYRPQPTGTGLTEVMTDTVMSPQQWATVLQNWETTYDLIAAQGNLGTSAASLLDLAYRSWEQGERPLWAEALPFYGQHPVEI